MRYLSWIGLLGTSLASDAAVYTFAPYTSLGAPPACNENLLDTLRDVLGIASSYPSSRILSQFKTVGLKKLMQIVARKNKKFTGDDLGRAHYGDLFEEEPKKSRMLLQIGRLRSLDSSYVQPEQEAAEKVLQDTIMQDILSKITALISANGGILTGSSSAGDALDHAKDDLQVNKFLAGEMMSLLVDQVVDQARLSIGGTTNLTMTSAMINLGEALCNSLELASQTDDRDAARDACVMENLLRELLTCNSLKTANATQDCEKVVVGDASKDHCPRAGQDARKSDTVIDISVNNWIDIDQGNMDRWLYKAVRHLYSFASTWKACGVKLSEIVLIPGWSVQAITRMNQNMVMSGHDEDTPISVLLQNDKRPCSFVVATRGTLTGVDWLVDFATTQVDLEVRGVKLGKGHGGFTNLAAPGAAFFAEYIDRLCPNDASPPVAPEVTFSGHSMGGSVSTLMALLSTEWLKARNARIGLVAFAAPSSIDEAAAKILLDRVAMRSWINAYDAVPKIPCAIKSGMVRCRQEDSSTFTSAPVSVVGEQSIVSGRVTDATTPGRDHYVSNPNEISLSAKEIVKLMPTVQEHSFGNFSYALSGGGLSLENIRTPGPLQLSALHSDVYGLYLDSYFC